MNKIQSQNHALQTGYVLGAFMRAGLKCSPVMDGSDYSAEIEINLSEDMNFTGEPLIVTVVVKPPA